MVAIRTASHRATRGDGGALGCDTRPPSPLYAALLSRVFAAVNAAAPPFADLDGTLVAAGLASSSATAADDVAWDEPIRQSMAEAFAAAGGVVGRRPSCCSRTRSTASWAGCCVPPTGADALGLWDAVVDLVACPVCWSCRVPALHDLRSQVAPALAVTE
jgi:hypothetical protein